MDPTNGTLLFRKLKTQRSLINRMQKKRQSCIRTFPDKQKLHPSDSLLTPIIDTYTKYFKLIVSVEIFHRNRPNYSV